MTIPFVRIVTINFDGGDMTLKCLDSLLATDWPKDRFEIVMVDNGSLDGIVEVVKKTHPEIRVVEPLKNTGFAGGSNLGLHAPGPYDYVVLVNNDATVPPNWLKPIIEAFAADPKIGTVSPKILFDSHFIGARLSIVRSAGEDELPPGDVWLIAAEFDGKSVTEDIRASRGFSNPNGDPRTGVRSRTLNGVAEIHLPVDKRTYRPDSELKLLCSASSPTVIRIKGDAEVEVTIEQPQWITVPRIAHPYRVINNAGSALFQGWHGGDVGFFERDEQRFCLKQEIVAWCGGAVALSAAYVRDLGGFDERFFLYYEDTDFALRGLRRGWKHVLEPSSFVLHKHGGSGGEGSPAFRYFVSRNRLLLIAKHAPIDTAISEFLRNCAAAAVCGLRDVVIPLARARRPDPRGFLERVAVLRSALALAPAMLWSRRGQGTAALPALISGDHTLRAPTES